MECTLEGVPDAGIKRGESAYSKRLGVEGRVDDQLSRSRVTALTPAAMKKPRFVNLYKLN